MSINLFVKSSNDQRYSVQVTPASDTVLALKEKLLNQVGATATSQLRLIFAGRVMRDEDLVEKYRVQEGNTIHLVRSGGPPASNTSTTTTAAATAPVTAPVAPPLATGFSGAAGAAAFANMTASPDQLAQLASGMPPDPAMLQQSLQLLQQHPELMDVALQSAPPHVRQMMQQPGMRRLLANPQVLMQMMQLQQTMQESGLSPADLMGLDAGAIPNQQAAAAPGLDPAVLQQVMGSLSGGTSPNTSSQPTGAVPNNALLQQMLAAMGGTGLPATTPPSNLPPPEVRFQVQLQQLNDMGFYDAEANIRALLAAGGNVNVAIERLLSTL